MKFRPSYLFYLLAIFSLILIPITNNSSIEQQTGNTFYVIAYFHYFALTFMLSLITGLVYSFMDRLKKPISTKVSIIHFSLITIGLLLSLNFYRTIVTFSIGGIFPDTAAIAFDKTSLFIFISGPLLLTIGLFVFTYGILKAIPKTNFQKLV